MRRFRRSWMRRRNAGRMRGFGTGWVIRRRMPIFSGRRMLPRLRMSRNGQRNGRRLSSERLRQRKRLRRRPPGTSRHVRNSTRNGRRTVQNVPPRRRQRAVPPLPRRSCGGRCWTSSQFLSETVEKSLQSSTSSLTVSFEREASRRNPERLSLTGCISPV